MPIDIPQFGRVMAICVGAMVGSIIKGMVQWDEDLINAMVFHSVTYCS